MRFYDSRTGRFVESLPWQDNLRPGDFYLIENPFVGVSAGGVWQMAETLECSIFGQVLDGKGCGSGFFHVRAYSSMCPEGEEGVISIVDPTRVLTPAEFETARQANWSLGGRLLEETIIFNSEIRVNCHNCGSAFWCEPSDQMGFDDEEEVYLCPQCFDHLVAYEASQQHVEHATRKPLGDLKGTQMKCPNCEGPLSSLNIAAEWESDHIERWVDHCNTCGWTDDEINAVVFEIDENGKRYDENGECVDCDTEYAPQPDTPESSAPSS